MIEKLKEIRETLDNVEVHGQQNLYLLLGSIQELDRLIMEVRENGRCENPGPSDN